MFTPRNLEITLEINPNLEDEETKQFIAGSPVAVCAEPHSNEKFERYKINSD